jgi:hypothetical protein
MAQIGASQNDKPSKKDKEELSSTSTKAKIDFGPILEASIPQNRDLALKEGKPAEAIENLLGVEKQTRLAGDAIATGLLWRSSRSVTKLVIGKG